MSHRWYQTTVIYCVEVASFQDSDGDGRGDLRGLISRLDNLAELGVGCLWLNPIHPTPGRDNGYDVSDYYGVDPRLGSLGDFAELTQAAHDRGIRVVLDLVVNHTSDEHPWFVDARSNPGSRYRDWYVWSVEEPPNRQQGMVFPGEQEETWSWDPQAQAWYFHRFYGFQPDLNWSNPDVRAEIAKVMAFWLKLGVSGFRIDAAPFVLEQIEPGVDPGPTDFSILDSWRQETQWQAGDSVLLCEANVDPADVGTFTGSRPDGPTDRAQLLFDFVLNPKLWLALARREAEPLVEALQTGIRLARGAQWVSFLRNHDELDLSRLTEEQRSDVFAAFAPKEDMRLYGRGIRRRLGPMLGGDQRRIELAYALQFALPGTPVIRYGEEIGMGDDLSLDGRESVRTPMPWDDGPNAGFSAAPADQLVRPVVMDGDLGASHVNVRAQRRDPHSLLRWMGNLVDALRLAPEIGTGGCAVVDVPLPRSVLAHRFDAPSGSILLLHNLDDTSVTLDLSSAATAGDDPYDLLFDGPYDAPEPDLTGVQLRGFGYRWIRLARSDCG